jgi:hypothetical protein
VPSDLPFINSAQLLTTTVGDAVAVAQRTGIQGAVVSDLLSDGTMMERLVGESTLSMDVLRAAVQSGVAAPVGRTATREPQEAEGLSIASSVDAEETVPNNPRVIASRLLDEYLNGPLE